MEKKVLALSDFHCGHMTGLTPPTHFLSSKTKIGKAQRCRWDAFKSMLGDFKNPDVLLFLGDAIDGSGERSSGTELLTSDRMEQAEWAVEVFQYVNAKNCVMVFGTPYHTGMGEDFENIVANNTGSKIESHSWVRINNVVFDLKHKTGGSQVPHGRHTGVAKENLWNSLWAHERQQCPRSNVFLRGHVHNYNFCGGVDWTGFTLPALQGLGSKFGERQCSGIVDFGLLKFSVKDGEYSWKSETKTIASDKAQVIEL